MSKTSLISALPPLAPTLITNTKTGEILTTTQLNHKLNTLITHITNETINLYSQHKTVLLEKLLTYKSTPAPAEYARQSGFKTDLVSVLPREVKAKSRLEKLVQHKLITEVDSFVKNPQKNKAEPTFNQQINLGAVDNQMASLSINNNTLTLLFKCWDKELLLEFTIPKYILERKILKFSLPVIRLNKHGEYVFDFSVTEKCKVRKGSAHTVGIDLGIVKPYVMSVVNHKGVRVAHYESSPYLTKLVKKQAKLNQEKAHIRAKIKNRLTRGLISPTQETELERVSNKSTRLTKTVAQLMGNEIANKLSKHNSNLIKVENLSWVSGTKNSKIGSSRWAHSTQQDAITHATTRVGYKVKKVSARGTSQECHACNATITHSIKSRTVWCGVCKLKMDRDFNSSMVIAKRKVSKLIIFPVGERLHGGTTLKSGTTLSSKKSVIRTNYQPCQEF